MFGRSNKCQAALKEYGLDGSSMAVIGADKPADSDDWLVMVSGEVSPHYLDVDTARKLARELSRIGEMMLAQRLSGAAETAQRQMRPAEG